MSRVGDGAEGAAATEGEDNDVGGAEAGAAADGVSFGGCAVGTGGATGDSKSVAELGVAAGDTRCAEEANPVGIVTIAGSVRPEKCAPIANKAPRCASRKPGTPDAATGKLRNL